MRFDSRPVNLVVVTLAAIALFVSAGAVGSVLSGGHLSIAVAAVAGAIPIPYAIAYYRRYVKRIEISEDDLLIVTNLTSFRDAKANFQFREKAGMTRTFHRYREIIIFNVPARKRFKIVSDDWDHFAEVRDALVTALAPPADAA